MNAIEEKARSQIMAIEQVHGIKFLNREETARLISQSTSDGSQVLLVCTAINFWAAGNKIKGEAKIPEELVLDMMKIKRQRYSGKPRKARKKGIQRREKD